MANAASEVQRIGAQVLGKRCLGDDLRLVDAELVGHYCLHSVQDCRHYRNLRSRNVEIMIEI